MRGYRQLSFNLFVETLLWNTYMERKYFIFFFTRNLLIDSLSKEQHQMFKKILPANTKSWRQKYKQTSLIFCATNGRCLQKILFKEKLLGRNSKDFSL